MAVQVRYIRADSTQELEEKVNAFLAEMTKEARNIVTVVTSFPDMDGYGGYVAVVQRSAPHLRTFEGGGG